MADGATVDFQLLDIVFGKHRIKGRANGQSLSISYEVDAFQSQVGVDGIGFWIKSSNRSAIITVTLVQNARSNTVLSGLHLSDLWTPGGLMLPLEINERNGASLATAERARIIKMADMTWSDGGEARVWTLKTTNLEAVCGEVYATPIDPQPVV